MKKKPFALLINDIHISKDSIQDFAENWEEALCICEDYEINKIIVGGDMFQARAAQTLDVLIAVKRALLKATKEGITVFIAEGNHDKVDQEALDGYNSLFGEYQNVCVISTWMGLPVSGDVTLYIMSYFPENGSFVQHFNNMVDSLEDHVNILYCHEGIRGGLAMPSEDELPADMFKPFDAVLVGHYHNRKKIPGTNIEYIGSSRQHNFGEDEEKGYTVLYTDGNYKFIKNEANKRYRVIDVDAAAISSDLKDAIDKLNSMNYKIKVRLYTDEITALDKNTKQKLIDLGVTKVEVVSEESVVNTKSQSISQKFDKNGIKNEYKNFCSKKDVDNVEMGLKYLDKIKYQ